MNQENQGNSLTMTRQSAASLVMYLQKAHAIVPTTGQEWDSLRNAVQVVELVANGRVVCEVKQPESQHTNGKDLNEEYPSAN